ncbi:hypothetical protein OAK38_08235 [Verrucomicrobia bacterium]|nr:hypothetical protein [Verrucomicrobiota bacterium]
MNEDNSKKPDEGRLIDYLLNESSPEERAQIEGLCGESTEWQEAKKELEGTLGLIEDACKRPAPEIQEEMKLDSGRIKELEALHSGQSQEGEEQEAKEPESDGRTLLFKPAIWAPLAAAACAALLVWGPGQSLEEQTEEQLATAQSIEKEKIGESQGEALATDAKRESADPDIELDKQADLDLLTVAAIEPVPADFDELGSAQALELEALDEANRVLGKRSREDVAKLQSRIAKDAESISLADAFSSGRSNGAGIGSAPPAAVQALPAPVTSSEGLSPSVASNFSDDDVPAVNSAAVLTKERSVEVVAETELLALGNNDKLDSVPTQRDGLKIVDRFEAGVDKEFSRKSLSREAKSAAVSDFSSSLKRSKPGSWTDLVRKPASCFLFNKDGQALGQVMVSQSEGKTIGIRRIGEIRQGKRFLLTPGQFELRFADQSGGSVVILSGDLKRGNLSNENASKEEEQSKRSSDGDYEFEAKDAWWLDQSEVRQALPVSELAR